MNEEGEQETSATSTSAGAEPTDVSKEEEIFTLLFKECNINGSGWANVDLLVDTIQQMIPSSPKKGEDVYDSDESVHEALYNLDLLRCMLDNHSINGEINEVSYIHVIRNWVKDIRSRSESPTSENSLEHSNLSVEEEADSASNALFQESFETTGGGGVGGGSFTQEMDQLQLASTITELQAENKRLSEYNQQLRDQIFNAEETTKQALTGNQELTEKLKSHQQSMVLMESIKQENQEIAQRLIDEEAINDDLRQQIETMNRKMNELETDISDLQNRLASDQDEKDTLHQEARNMRQLLNQKENLLAQMESERSLIEARLEERDQETSSLRQVLSNTKEAMEDLESENTSLQAMLKEPVSSTPYRPMAPSLLEELAESGITEGMSPVTLPDTSVDDLMDSLEEDKDESDFNKITDKAFKNKVKFQQKATLMRQGLSELIDTPLTTSMGGAGERSRMADSFVSNKENEDVFETKLRKLESTKKRDRQKNQKLSDELNALKRENETLKERCQHLRDELQRQNVPVVTETDGIVATPSDVHLLLTSHPPTHETNINQRPPLADLQVTVSVQTDDPIHQTAEETSGRAQPPFLATPIYDQEKYEFATPLGGASDYQSTTAAAAVFREPVLSIEDTSSRQEERENTPSEEQEEELTLEEALTSGQEESRLESILRQRRQPQLEISDIVEESFAPKRPSCFSLLLSFLFAVFKWTVRCLLLLIIILILIITLITFNSTIGRCGGQYCSHSPLHMLLGQHLKYYRTGEVPT